MQAGEPGRTQGTALPGRGITALPTAQLPILVVPHNLLAESALTVIAATFYESGLHSGCYARPRQHKPIGG